MWAYRAGPDETYESELPAHSELLAVNSPAQDDWYDEYEPELPEVNAPIPLEEVPIAQVGKTFEELLEEQLSLQDVGPESVSVPQKRKAFLKRKEGGLSSAIKKPTAKANTSGKKQPERTEQKKAPTERQPDKKAEKPVDKRPPPPEKPAKPRTSAVRVKTAPPKASKRDNPEAKAIQEPKYNRSPEKKASAPTRKWSPEKPAEIEYDRNALEDVDSDEDTQSRYRINELDEKLQDFRTRNKQLTLKMKEYSETYQELEANIDYIQTQKKSVKAQYEAALEAELKKRRSEFLELLKAKEQGLSDRKDPEVLNELRSSLSRLREEANLVEQKNKIELRELQMELQDEGRELEELEAKAKASAKLNFH